MSTRPKFGCNDPGYAEPQYPARYDQTLVAPYVHDNSGGKVKNITPVCILMLRYNRMAYCKSQPGDCGSPQSSGGLSPYAIAQSSGGIAGASFGIAGAIGGAGSAAAATAATASLVLAPVGVLIGVFSTVSAHHKQAVATEQTTLCQVVNAWNGVLDNLEPAVAGGNVSLQQAIQYLQNAHDALVSMLKSIEKNYNAAFYYHCVLDSLLAFNKKYVMPSLLPNQQTVVAPQGPAGSGAPSPSGASATVSNSPTTNTGYLAAAGLIGAKLAGVY